MDTAEPLVHLSPIFMRFKMLMKTWKGVCTSPEVKQYGLRPIKLIQSYLKEKMSQ
jgi:hypothetical protein